MNQYSEESPYIFRPRFGQEADIARLGEQYAMLAQVIPLFSPHFTPHGDETILDIGCGPGGWALDVAFAHPHMRVVGLDLDERVIQHATFQARAQQRDQVSFEVADATHALPFRDESVDYIHLSLANSFVLREQWPLLFAECHRILRPGGWLRSIEWLVTQTSSSAAFQVLHAFQRAFVADGRRYTEPAVVLGHLLREAGMTPEPLAVHVLNFSESTPAHFQSRDDFYVGMSLAQPFVLTSTHMERELFERLLEEAQRDMMLPHFFGAAFFAENTASRRETVKEGSKTYGEGY